MNFAGPADQRVKFEESEKRDKYLGLAREQKKNYEIYMEYIPIVSGALATIPQGSIKGQEDLEMSG